MRTEIELGLEIHELPAFVYAALSLDVMGKNKGELFPLRPTGPVGRWPFASRQDRPNI